MHDRSIQRCIGRFSWAATTPPKQQRKDCGKPFSISTPRSPRIQPARMAHAGLAEAYAALSGFYMDPREAMPKAKRAAETALRLDDVTCRGARGAGLHSSRLRLGRAGRGEGAARARSTSIPPLASARLNYAAYLTSQARHDEAVERDPTSGRPRSAVDTDPLVRHLFLLFTRRYDEAIELAEQGIGVGTQRRVHAGLSGCGVRAAGPIQ